MVFIDVTKDMKKKYGVYPAQKKNLTDINK